jgi:hypothetical protein
VYAITEQYGGICKIKAPGKTIVVVTDPAILAQVTAQEFTGVNKPADLYKTFAIVSGCARGSTPCLGGLGRFLADCMAPGRCCAIVLALAVSHLHAALQHAAPVCYVLVQLCSTTNPPTCPCWPWAQKMQNDNASPTIGTSVFCLLYFTCSTQQGVGTPVRSQRKAHSASLLLPAVQLCPDTNPPT